MIACPLCVSSQRNLIQRQFTTGTRYAVYCSRCAYYGPFRSLSSEAIACWDMLPVLTNARIIAALARSASEQYEMDHRHLVFKRAENCESWR